MRRTFTTTSPFTHSIPPLSASPERGTRVERGNLILENVPETPVALAERLRLRQELHHAQFLDWTADGEAMLISMPLGPVAQIVQIAAALGTRRQLTFSAEPLRNAVAQPGGNGFVFARDAGGDEYHQLYFRDMRTGEDVCLTDGKASRNVGALWSKDGNYLAYVHSPEGTHRTQIRIARAGALTKPRTILDRDVTFSIEDWSADGKVLLVSRYVSITESYLYTLSVADGQLREINSQRASAPTIGYNAGRYPQILGTAVGGPPKGGRFSLDGRSLYVISDEDSEFARLTRINLSTGLRTALTGDIGWDVEAFDLSPDGSTLVYAINEDGASKLRVMDATGVALPAPPLQLGVVSDLTFDRVGGSFAFTFSGASAPADVYVWDIAEASLTRWTASEVAGVNPAALAEPERIRFPSFDGREIAAFLYCPKRVGKLPVIVHLHGGPEAQFRPAFDLHPYNCVISGLELGFAAIAPNVRGSTGYGKTFATLDNGMKREDAVKDIGALLDWIANQPFLDKERVVLHGNSYGGYMVNASTVQFSNRVKAAISIDAISNFHSFLSNTAEYRRDMRRAEYGDERNLDMAAFLHRISPLARAREITVPMFIIHGANDPRVPVTEAEQLFAALKANGAKPWLLIAKDEGHGFQKKDNLIRLDEAKTLFLQQIALCEEGG